MDDLNTLYKEALEREKELTRIMDSLKKENKPQSLAVTIGRHTELQLMILRIQQLLIKNFKSKK